MTITYPRPDAMYMHCDAPQCIYYRIQSRQPMGPLLLQTHPHRDQNLHTPGDHMTLIIDSGVNSTTIDVNCDWPGCGEFISDMVGIGRTDEHKLYERTLLRMAAQMKNTATDLGWQILSSFADKNNTDLCHHHFVRQQMNPVHNDDWTMVAHNATRTGTGKTYIPPTD